LCFCAQKINNLFTKRDNDRGVHPIGVTLDEESSRINKYIASCSVGKRAVKHIGRFSTIEEAFNTYKTFKENYIKQIADEYKDRIPKKLYDAMYRYEVE
jgi:hypothetical protein